MLKIAAFIVLIIAALLLGIILVAWLWLRAPDVPPATLHAKYLGANDFFVDLPGELHLHYRDQGPKDKPVLLLLHGYGDSYATWEPWVALLLDRYRVISLDLPGHGLSDAPADYQLDSDAYARVVTDFAAQLQLPRFALAGNSMGGGVAWKVALAAPQRLSALILVDAAGWPAANPGQSPSLAFRILAHPLGRKLLEHIDNRPLIAQGLKAQVYNPALITEALVARWADYQLLPGHRRILMSAQPGGHSQATPELLANIKLPTLVLHGASDSLIPPSSARKFADAIAGARLIIYPDAGHLPQREVPEQSARDVAAFLQSHGI